MHVNIYFLSAVAGVLAVVWEIFQLLRKNQKDSISDIIHHALLPVRTQIDMIKSDLSGDISLIKTDLAVIRTKVDPMWEGWNGNVARNAAVLHHPEPSRARVDYLLDCLRDKTITSGELEELRGHLETIMHWEEGKPAPYKIYQGEQSAAANMLSALDVVHSEYIDGLPDSTAGSSEEAGTGLPD
jgi:hypothetical protein